MVTAKTGDAGAYIFSPLPPGSYDMSVQKDGFKPYKRYDLRATEDPVRLEVRLAAPVDDFTVPLKDIEAAVNDKPSDPANHFHLARRYLLAGEGDKANTEFERAIMLQPDYAPAQMGAAQLAIQRGEPRTALAYAEQMQKQKPGSVMPSLVRAAALVRMNQLADARATINAVLKDSPDETDALLQLGLLDLREKQLLDAELPLRRAYRLDPTNLQGLQALAQIHITENQPDKAIAVFTTELERAPDSRDLRRELANTEYRVSRFDKALVDYQAVVDTYKAIPLEQAALYARIAEVYQHLGNLNLATESAKKAVSIAPEQAQLYSMLAQYYDMAGNKNDAAATYRTALKLDPNNPLVMNNLAFLMSNNGGDLDEALSLAQRARRRLPNLDAVEDTIGWIYLKKDLVDSASRTFEELVRKYPKNASFHMHYAAALARKGNKTEALAQLDLALQSEPTKDEEATIRDMIKKLS